MANSPVKKPVVEDVPMVEFRLKVLDDKGVMQTEIHRVPESDREQFEKDHGLR